MLMPTVRLLRVEENADYGTFGVLIISSQVFCVTLEPADLENKSFVSSIPAQQYYCKRHVSSKFGETFLVEKVPDRTDVLFHKGNVIGNTSGCILLGQFYDKLRENRAIRNSGNTFKKFMEILKGHNYIQLTIKEVY